MPTILVLSLPRSGSSWVGETLGRSNAAAYLREPLTTTYRDSGGRGTVFEVDPRHPPEPYRRASALAFAGIPRFPASVVIDPSQWSLRDRNLRQVVIKEVNPLACKYYLQAFRPYVVFLVRHPVSVALSYLRLGWWDVKRDDHFFGKHGEFQGQALSAAWESLNSYGEKTTVVYEDLCGSPMTIFRDIFDGCGLNWATSTEEFIRSHTAQGDRSVHWSTSRDSSSMARDWQGKVTPEELAEIREAYQKFQLPWYRSLDDWKRSGPLSQARAD